MKKIFPALFLAIILALSITLVSCNSEKNENDEYIEYKVRIPKYI